MGCRGASTVRVGDRALWLGHRDGDNTDTGTVTYIGRHSQSGELLCINILWSDQTALTFCAQPHRCQRLNIVPAGFWDTPPVSDGVRTWLNAAR
jgi:hypothetical protein